jgi:hypothetical protein
MLEDAVCKFKLNFDGEGVKIVKKFKLKKIHAGNQYPEQISQEERMYIIYSEL